jgi:hypothetical protein
VIPEIVTHPLVPTWLMATWLVAALLLLGVAVARGARGWLMRALALAALGAALLDPRVVQEERHPRPDLALLVVDESPSQNIGARASMAETARAGVEAALAAFDGIEVRTIRTGGDARGETRLFDAIERAALDSTDRRLGGVVIISDGQVHDVPPPGSTPWLNAPVHLLLTGGKDERDRRVVVEQAPAYGIVDQEVEISYRVEQTGPAPGKGGPVGVRVRIDGEERGSTQAQIDRSEKFPLSIRHAGPTVLELEVEPANEEVSTLNNRAAVVVNGVRERLRVLLVSGQPHPGERTWRNLLKSDPSVDLVHFTILRPPEKDDATPLKELSLIVFPVQELFENKLYDFDLVVFDRYVVRGILPTPYYGRIADYVRQGGALLVAVGPEFAGVQSLFRTPLGDVLPASPKDRVIEQAFRPQVTDVGRRHPVTSGLPGETVAGDADPDDASSEPTWGPWFRLVDGDAKRGTTLMTGAGGRPLLVVDRVGEGRVAQLMSDHIWLWARGFEGGGPQAELLRRLAHWLMKEPELEEEHLEARVADGRLLVERRSLGVGDVDVTIIDPSGQSRTLRLEAGHDGLARGEVRTEQVGLWRVSDGVHTAFASAGRINPPEFTDLRATPDRLAPLTKATGGGIAWLADGMPEFRRTLPGRAAAGRGWLGIQRHNSYSVTGLAEVPLLPVLVLLAATLGGLAGAWWREGR